MTKNDIFDKLKNKDIRSYGKGTTRCVYKLNSGEILKMPRYSPSLLKEQKLEEYEYNKYLSGTNQTLTEILIWEKMKDKTNILCPILEYGIKNNIIYTVNQKLIPAERYINQKDFDLEYFCRKMDYDYSMIVFELNKIALQFNLELDDLISNEGNFGVDTFDNTIKIIDYGYNIEVDFSNNSELKRKNKELICNLF